MRDCALRSLQSPCRRPPQKLQIYFGALFEPLCILFGVSLSFVDANLIEGKFCFVASLYAVAYWFCFDYVD